LRKKECTCALIEGEGDLTGNWSQSLGQTMEALVEPASQDAGALP